MADIYYKIENVFPPFEEFCMEFSDKIEMALRHIGDRRIGKMRMRAKDVGTISDLVKEMSTKYSLDL